MISLYLGGVRVFEPNQNRSMPTSAGFFPPDGPKVLQLSAEPAPDRTEVISQRCENDPLLSHCSPLIVQCPWCIQRQCAAPAPPSRLPSHTASLGDKCASLQITAN